MGCGSSTAVVHVQATSDEGTGGRKVRFSAVDTPAGGVVEGSSPSGRPVKFTRPTSTGDILNEQWRDEDDEDDDESEEARSSSPNAVEQFSGSSAQEEEGNRDSGARESEASSAGGWQKTTDIVKMGTPSGRPNAKTLLAQAGGGGGKPSLAGLAMGGRFAKVAIAAMKENRIGMAPVRDVNHVSQCAVSLQWLVDVFLKEHPHIIDDQWTTADVVFKIVKPTTEDNKCRYIKKLIWGKLAKPRAVSRGKAFYFVSHGWARPFAELVAMLCQHFSNEQQALWRPDKAPLAWGEVFVWLDIFAINQHPSEEQKNDLEGLRDVVADAEQTLMVLDRAGAVLTRIWCLYEAWQTSRRGPGHLVIMSYGVDFQPMAQVFLKLDVGDAKATQPSDLDMILTEIRRDCGVKAMNHELKSALVDSAVNEVPPEGQAWTQEQGWSLTKAAQLLQMYGRLNEAESLYRRDLKGREAVLGKTHKSTLSCKNNLASLLQAHGRYGESEQLYQEVTSSSSSGKGNPDVNALISMSNLANQLKAQGNYVEAEKLFNDAAKKLEKKLGRTHADTLSAKHNVASMMHVQGRYKEAEPLLRQVLKDSEGTNGKEHPATLNTVNELGMLLKSLSQYQEGEALLRRALAGREKVLGDGHHDTPATLNNLASMLQAQGRHAEAEPMFSQARAQLMKLMGPDHPEVLSATNNLAMVLKAQGKNDLAAEMYEQVLADRERIHGAAHPNTLTTMNNVAVLYKQMGRLDDAERLSRRALEGRTKQLGPDHPNTLVALNNLGCLLMDLQRLDEAEAAFLQVFERRLAVLGYKHPDTVSSMEWMMQLYESLGGKSKQIEYINKKMFAAEQAAM